jgi:multidrug efflux pump subunit AcrA (membrane-fusion protein)
MQKKSFYIGIWIIGSLLLTACTNVRIPGITSGQNNQAQRTVTATSARVTVEKGAIESRVIGSGSVVARTTINIPFLRSGQITAINVKEGDTVKKGQVLAQLDTTDLLNTVKQQQANYLSAQVSYSQTVKGPNAADLKAAQASLASAQAAYADLSSPPTEAELAGAKADLMTAEADLRQKQAAYERRAARDPGVGASAEALALESSTNSYNKVKAAYDAKFEKATKAQFASASAQIANAQKNIESLKPVEETIQLAKIKLDQALLSLQLAEQEVQKATLVSPVDGLVTSVNFDAGEWAGSGATAIVVANFDEPLFEISLDEADLGKVQIGQDARIQLQSYLGQKINAKVDSISTVGATVNNIVTYKVKLRVPKTDNQPKIFLNMSGTSEIITSKIDEAILVPSNALIINSTSKTYSVLKVVGDSTQMMQVEIGARSGDKTQILKGVSAGDVLAIPQTTTSTQPQGGPQPQVAPLGP